MPSSKQHEECHTLWLHECWMNALWKLLFWICNKGHQWLLSSNSLSYSILTAIFQLYLQLGSNVREQEQKEYQKINGLWHYITTIPASVTINRNTWTKSIYHVGPVTEYAFYKLQKNSTRLTWPSKNRPENQLQHIQESFQSAPYDEELPPWWSAPTRSSKCSSLEQRTIADVF